MLCGAMGSTQGTAVSLMGYSVQRSVKTNSNTKYEIQKYLKGKEHKKACNKFRIL